MALLIPAHHRAISSSSRPGPDGTPLFASIFPEGMVTELVNLFGPPLCWICDSTLGSDCRALERWPRHLTITWAGVKQGVFLKVELSADDRPGQALLVVPALPNRPPDPRFFSPDEVGIALLPTLPLRDAAIAFVETLGELHDLERWFRYVDSIIAEVCPAAKRQFHLTSVKRSRQFGGVWRLFIDTAYSLELQFPSKLVGGEVAARIKVSSSETKVGEETVRTPKYLSTWGGENLPDSTDVMGAARVILARADERFREGWLGQFEAAHATRLQQ